MIETALTFRQLEEAVHNVEPAAVLVPRRILRRVIRADHAETGVALQVPHRKSYVTDGKHLLDIVTATELGLTKSAAPPEYVILLLRPEDEMLARLPRSTSLVKYWRLLFHACVHRALEQHSQAGKLTYDEIHRRISRIGSVAFDEVRTVLTQEHFLTAQADDRRVYIEFAATYLELRHFVPALLPLYFPALARDGQVDAVLAEDVPAESLFQATRLAETPDALATPTDPGTYYDISLQPPDAPSPDARLSAEQRDRIVHLAEEAAAKGNDVRAAILRKQASSADARAAVERLAQRLQAALGFDDTERPAWRRMLTALLEPAAQGAWPASARLLYDLQKICLDHERPLFALTLGDWALSLGRRPLTRPLPDLKFVRAQKRLASALGRLTSAGLSDVDRRDSAAILKTALARSAQRIRTRVRPVILTTLDDVGLRPANFPERISRDKLVEELLDRITEISYLTMSDLRDGLSRNQLKLPELEYLGDLYRGDPLLLWDRRLADALPGIYHPGEIYLRLLQKISSLAFGNRVGRFATRYLVLPFGGAFVILEGLQHVVEPIAKRLSAREAVAKITDLDALAGAADATAKGTEAVEAHIHLMNPYSFTLLGLFLLLVLHFSAFRRQMANLLGGLFRGLRWCLFEVPAAALKLPLIRAALDSRPVRLCWQVAFKPLLLSLPFALILPLAGAGLNGWLIGTALMTLVTSTLLNSRLGRDLEEVSTDWLVRAWEQIRTDIVPGIFWFIMYVFRSMVEAIERLLYSVDEFLRFKEGDPRAALAFKAVFGTLWAGVRYVIRFCVNLLIEPQINPIKHFPVVTVSHKLVLTLAVPHMARAMAFTMNMDLAIALATAIGTLIPGIFGFLVWELKENWRLYQANRPETLTPAVIGHHGETMVRFLRVGFHSGTLPKLFARLRKARRRAIKTNQWKTFRKQRDALHHVEESLHRFLERDFLALLHHCRSWGGAPLKLGKITPATNIIRLQLLGHELTPLTIAMIERDGRLLARLEAPGWHERLSEPQRRALTLALAGLFQLSGVQQVGDRSCEATITWQQWVEAWEQDQAGKDIDVKVVAQNLPGL